MSSGHENGGWMNEDQRSAVRAEAEAKTRSDSRPDFEMAIVYLWHHIQAEQRPTDPGMLRHLLVDVCRMSPSQVVEVARKLASK